MKCRSIGKWQKLNQLQHKKRRKDQVREGREREGEREGGGGMESMEYRRRRRDSLRACSWAHVESERPHRQEGCFDAEDSTESDLMDQIA